MSYRCDVCKEQNWGAPIKVVSETRPMKYTNKVRGEEKVTYGHETVKELNICPTCKKAIT